MEIRVSTINLRATTTYIIYFSELSKMMNDIHYIAYSLFIIDLY